jgi:hypothetical protein
LCGCKRNRWQSPVVALAALILGSASAGASTISGIVLPGITANVHAEAGVTNEDSQVATLSAPPSMLTLTVIAQTLNSGASATAAGGDDPAIAVSASAGGDVFGSQAQAQASLSYSLEVVGPSGGLVTVDLMSLITGTFAASVSADGSATAFGSASLDLSGPSIGEVGFGFVDPATPQSIGVDTMVMLVPNAVYGVTMNVSVEALCGSQDVFGTKECDGGLASASAAVDPTFAIDPGFANGSQYQIAFSPDLSSPSGVPEPRYAELTGMLALTLGILRSVTRNRRGTV